MISLREEKRENEGGKREERERVFRVLSFFPLMKSIFFLTLQVIFFLVRFSLPLAEELAPFFCSTSLN